MFLLKPEGVIQVTNGQDHQLTHAHSASEWKIGDKITKDNIKKYSTVPTPFDTSNYPNLEINVTFFKSILTYENMQCLAMIFSNASCDQYWARIKNMNRSPVVIRAVLRIRDHSSLNNMKTSNNQPENHLFFIGSFMKIISLFKIFEISKKLKPMVL